eukprot:780903-Alexandrium_andersonii.AAC.1
MSASLVGSEMCIRDSISPSSPGGLLGLPISTSSTPEALAKGVCVCVCACVGWCASRGIQTT